MAGPSSPTDPADGIPCPYCGAAIRKNSGATQCPFCGEVLARALRRRLAPPSSALPVWMIGLPLLLCCWPVGAVMVAVGAPFRWRWRLLLIGVSLLVVVGGGVGYYRSECTNTVDATGTGSIQCGTARAR